MYAFALKCDENSVRRRIGCWGGDDGPLGYGLHGELATDPAEVVAVQKIGFAIFAQREDQGWATPRDL